MFPEMKRILFVIHTRQDFYLALSFLFMLRERAHALSVRVKLEALVVSPQYVAEFGPYLGLFDDFHVSQSCLQWSTPRELATRSRNPLAIGLSVSRFAKDIRELALQETDFLVAFSFREVFMNVMIRALNPRPNLVAIRKCDYEVAALQTRKKPIVSLYRNVLNSLFGYSRMRYRWHPDTDRSYTYSFLKNPYDHEFCLNPAHLVKNDGVQIPFPFSVLRAHARELGTDASGRSAIVVLGELYPFWEGADIHDFVQEFNRILDFIRKEFNDHDLIFKPRRSIEGLGLDLDGFTIAFQEISLESLLVKNAAIERVISFKSSGSFVAAQYGCEGYLLYPMLDMPESIRSALDVYFAKHQGVVHFVHTLADLEKTRGQNNSELASYVQQLSQPLLHTLLLEDL